MKELTDSTITLQKKFSRHDWACFHDSILEATDESHSQDTLEKLFLELPDEIKFTALQWGMSDTVFGDEVYTHFKPKPKSNPEKEPKKDNQREPMLSITSGFKGVGKNTVIRLHKPLDNQ